MAATGNEVVRLEQLKRLQPQIVSINYNKTASITLGNGEVVTFSTTGYYYIDLLVRAMYNSFELLQVSSSATVIDLKITTEVPMKTFKAKTGKPNKNDKVYGVSGTINGTLKSFNFNSGNEVDFVEPIGLIVFIGAVIYVE